MRRKTRQELRSDIDWTYEAVFEAFADGFWLEEDLRELEAYHQGDRWAYLWNSPWFEYDAPEWVTGRLGPVPGWWLPWAECPAP